MPKDCSVCSEVHAKYTCPVCLEVYCSLGCYKTHKQERCHQDKPEQHPSKSGEFSVIKNDHTNNENHPEMEVTKQSDSTTTEVTPKEDYTTSDTVTEAKLNFLSKDETIKDLLRNRHLRDLLKEIDVASNADVAMQKAMLEPIFVELADACLKVVEPANEATSGLKMPLDR